MKISVIMPCYNAESTISDQLVALSNQHWSDSWEVIIVDNKCTDNSMGIAKKFFDLIPNLRIIDANERQGPGYAMNVGVQEATADSLLFCDADDMVGEGWLSIMGKALEKYDFIASRMGVELLNSHLPKNHGYGNPQKNNVQMIWYPPFLPHAGAGTVGIKKFLHNAVGGFDESMPYLMDTDYCFRIQLLTHAKLYFVHDAIMHVRYRDTLVNTYIQSLNYAQYNVFLSKRYKDTSPPKPNLWKIYLGDWKKLINVLRRRRLHSSRVMIAWHLGRQIGRLVGVIKYRVPPV